MIGPAADPALQSWLRSWAIVLAASCAGMVAVVIGMLWILSGFHGLGLHPQTAVALILGTIGATALGVALMGLLFYSDRSNVDEAVDGAGSQQDGSVGGPRSGTGKNEPS
jgi:hypothetical protein